MSGTILIGNVMRLERTAPRRLRARGDYSDATARDDDSGGSLSRFIIDCLKPVMVMRMRISCL